MAIRWDDFPHKEIRLKIYAEVVVPSEPRLPLRLERGKDRKVLPIVTGGVLRPPR